jgi:hypothetical protein
MKFSKIIFHRGLIVEYNDEMEVKRGFLKI